MSPSVSPEDQEALLGVARRALERVAAGADVDNAWMGSQPVVDGKHWDGAFVSLHKRSNGELRGCIGFVPSAWGIVETVARAAEGAASRDPRFAPVASSEVPGLALEVSLLEKPRPIRPGDVVVGRHGLILESGTAHGLLLPQVPVEWGWDREAFLDHLAKKAGLPAAAWRDPMARVLAFEASVFAER